MLSLLRTSAPAILLAVVYLGVAASIYIGALIDQTLGWRIVSLSGLILAIVGCFSLSRWLQAYSRAAIRDSALKTEPSILARLGITHLQAGQLAGILGPLTILGLVFAIFAIADAARGFEGNFWSLSSFRLIMVQTAVVAVAALGMTLIVIAGGIDLAAGTALALTGVVLALALESGLGFRLAIGLGIGCGLVCGLVNGSLISFLRLPPFIITLGTMTVFLGIAKLIATDGGTVKPPRATIPAWLGDMVTIVPKQPWLAYPLIPNMAWGIWVVGALAILVAAVLHRTILGRYIFAIGSNESTARLCGVPIARTKLAIYTIAGLLVGVGGLFQFARLSQGDATSGVGLELRIIAAVIIGGASLSGGRGSIIGTLCGAMIMSVIKQGCSALGLANQLEDILLGCIIIAAVAVDRWRQR